jgi:YegS/Rv2252/BmrU family lipid kinase
LTAAVIVNPQAGSRRKRLDPEEACELLRNQDFQVESFVTRRPGEAVEVAARAAQNHSVVAAVGGDGTVREVATGLLGTQAALAILPCGSGNDFARAVGLSSPVEGARAAGLRQPEPVDVGYLDHQPFFNSAGFFLSGLVSGQAARLCRWAGPVRYRLAAVSALFTYRPQSAQWQLNGAAKPWEGRWLLAEVCNGPSTGGGFVLAPAADPTDGQLDFCFIRPVPLRTALALLPAAARGERLTHPAVERPRAPGATLICEEPVALHLDGEPTTLPAGQHRLWVQAGQLPVLTGKAPHRGDRSSEFS